MVTFEQFYNQTLPMIIDVINAQSNELILQRYLIYGLIGALILFIGYKIIRTIIFHYFIIDKKKRVKKKEAGVKNG